MLFEFEIQPAVNSTKNTNEHHSTSGSREPLTKFSSNSTSRVGDGLVSASVAVRQSTILFCCSPWRAARYTRHREKLKCTGNCILSYNVINLTLQSTDMSNNKFCVVLVSPENVSLTKTKQQTRALTHNYKRNTCVMFWTKRILKKKKHLFIY